MISDARKPGQGFEDGPRTGESGFIRRPSRLDDLAVDAGLRVPFRSIVGTTGMPHGELAERAEPTPEFAERALREFAAATGVPTTVRLLIPCPPSALEPSRLMNIAKQRRLKTRRIILELSDTSDSDLAIATAKALVPYGFLFAVRLTRPSLANPELLCELGADYLHFPDPPQDFEAAEQLRSLVERVTLRKGRAIVGNVRTEAGARLVEAAGVWLTYGDYLARARFLC
jgi:hypothetical protein